MKKILIAHSPDADDIFMYYAIRFGWVDTTANFENVAIDIETLNQNALQNIYDITAISFALYPHIFDEYALLRTGVSFGYGYGPKLVKLKDKKLKKNFKVALSGKYTTNAFIFRQFFPDARVTYMNFLEIENAVLNGEVDAGVLIHESILNYSDKLEVECEIWDLWCDLNKQDLPLPLGGMAIRRSIPLLDAIYHEESLIKAVDIANKHKQKLSSMLVERNLVRVKSDELDKYLNMYANEESISLNEKQKKAIDFMFKFGFDRGFYDKLITVEESLIDINYKNLRFS